MKAQFTFIVLLATLLFFESKAQNNSFYPFNIVPTAQRGIIKIIYAAQPQSPIKITFMSARGEIKSDRIMTGNYPTGVSKKYDIRKIKEKEFHIQISCDGKTATYHVTPSLNGQSLVSRLEKATIDNTVIAIRD